MCVCGGKNVSLARGHHTRGLYLCNLEGGAYSLITRYATTDYNRLGRPLVLYLE